MAKILVIDDDPTVQLVLQKVLQGQGYDVSVAAYGTEGVHQAHELKPALIICDWMMPQMDGLEVCRQVKTDPELSMTFFILLTSRDAVEDRVKGLDTGADEFLSKPINPNELLARVRAGLRLRDLMQALSQANQQLLARNELLESLSLTDPLTGVLNRRALDQALPHLLQQVGDREQSARYRYLSAFVLDVDYFKKVNDTYGHLAGDKVLQAIAGRLQTQALPNTLLYRYGGEEFVCITPGLSPVTATDYGEMLRTVISADPIKVSVELLIPVTISLGGAIAGNGNLVDSATLLHQADQALYQAKREGRNCLRMSALVLI